MEELKTLLLKEFEIIETEEDEAFAAVSLNPVVTWVKFILTDDQPNANKQRIPEEEFANLIKSGIFMPIKMAAQKINEGHDNSFPLGVITHLKQLKNQIVGLAALWSRERPEDVSLIKQKFSSKEPLELSWEVLYNDTNLTEDGVHELKGTALRAVTFVERPAYEGRTPVIAVASTQTDSKVEDTNLEELEKLQEQYASLSQTLTLKDEEIKTLNEELSTLREFKSQIDRAREEIEKIAGIRLKFSEAGIEKSDEYFTSNKDMLLGLAPEAMDFMIQELVAFSALHQTNSSTTQTNSSAPNLNSLASNMEAPSIKELAEYLRKTAKK